MSKKNENDELVGFREFLEHDEKKIPVRRERQGGFELQTFLEREIKRVASLLDLMQDRSLMVSQYPQQDKILKRIRDQKQDFKAKITKIALTEQSAFSENLDELWRKHFN